MGPDPSIVLSGVISMNAFKLTVAAATAAFLAFSGSAFSQDKAKSKGKLAKEDQQALTRLAQGDRAEIAAGKVALKKGNALEVKQYAEHMVKEHTRMLEKGSQVAKAKGVNPPASPDAKHQAALKKLEKLSGAQFDKAYIAQMVQDHQEMLSLAQKTAQSAKDGELKSHASQGVQHIQEHLQKAQELQASLGGSSSAGSSTPKPAKKK
jgi:putative membrane protein